MNVRSKVVQIAQRLLGRVLLASPDCAEEFNVSGSSLLLYRTICSIEAHYEATPSR